MPSGKKTVVLYGVKQLKLRREAEAFLDDDFRIIGFSDGHYTFDILEGRPFYAPAELKTLNIDYILLLSYSEATLAQMRVDLLLHGIPDGKIVDPILFLPSFNGIETLKSAISNGNIVERIDRYYHGEEYLLFGLSYCKGLLPEYTNFPFFNCATASMDIYYNLAVFRYMRNKGLLTNVKEALCLFPYYYLNLDSSRSRRSYQNACLYGIWQLNDLHHFPETAGAENYIANYRMFFSKFNAMYCSSRVSDCSYSRIIYQGDDYSAAPPPIFYKKHLETIEENRALFFSFVDELTDAGIKIRILIPPFYLKGYTQAGIELMYEVKQEFYDMIAELKTHNEHIGVYDFFEQFSDKRSFFDDLQHLNVEGAKEFSRLVNGIIS